MSKPYSKISEKEIENSMCLLASNVHMGGELADEVDIMGGFYYNFSPAILIVDSHSKESITTFSIHVPWDALSDIKLPNEVVINHDIVGGLDTDYKGIVDELSINPITPVRYNLASSFLMTLKPHHYDRIERLRKEVEKVQEED